MTQAAEYYEVSIPTKIMTSSNSQNPSPVPQRTAEFVNETVSEALNLQLRTLDVIHNKSNWLAGYNIALMGGILSIGLFDLPLQFFLSLPFLLSLVFVMSNFWAVGFLSGPGLEIISHYKDSEYVDLVTAVDDRRIKHHRENAREIGNLWIRMKIAIGFFYGGLSFLLLTFFIKYFLCLR